ncbi:uncharacterized protein BDW43DRAFT_305895 [Aspergillus alliaceus]|uniref:uncharacterized protein n=1 Tax=Petromyces alliaceus TaxID=209559 RepID=UPI0012A72A18|nr:uncharacterized protein BDW43DRAFT_305895 [Aspergillus alliaceus]KAB8239009.1 hypothetical protein BDW43DRAFT_305895 [Aspergillus alliaceus]
MASRTASYLSSDNCYDFVVATTQESINTTMKQYLFGLKQPEVIDCYVDQHGNDVSIKLGDLLQKSENVNPFDIPHDVDEEHDPRVKKIKEARFTRAWRARLGFPMNDPSKVPDVVKLGSDASRVNFKMFCAEFQVVALIPSTYDKPRWINVSQKKDQPWIFTSEVKLGIRHLDFKSGYGMLPAEVQKRTEPLKRRQDEASATIFSIQQLLLDLENANLTNTLPIIDGLSKNDDAYKMLQKSFLGPYFQKMKSKGEPLLGIVIRERPQTTNPTLKVTDFEYNVNPYVDSQGYQIMKPDDLEQRATTLNYLCVADGRKLRNATQFPWNWVDKGELVSRDGALAVNRNSLARFLISKLHPYVRKACVQIKPILKVHPKTVEVEWKATDPPPDVTIDLCPKGTKVITFKWISEEAEDSSGIIYKSTSKTQYYLDVEFINDTIILTQRQVIHLKVRLNVWNGEADIIDKSITETYSLGVNSYGELEAKLNVAPVNDKSKKISIPEWKDILFANGFNEAMEKSAENARIAAYQLKVIPTSIIQDYVFPGGKVFIFKDPCFSEHQDLLASISYSDPR